MSESSVYKGFNFPVKAKVTRIDDPSQLNRIQVYIPSYHGEYNESHLGYGDDPGYYPWATMCSILFKDTGNYTVDALKELYAGDLPMIYPAVGTVGWVMFEGGDIRSPIYMGSLSKGEVNETVEGMYQGSDVNNLTTSSGSTLDVMADIIFEQEGGGKNYGNINPCDVDAISIGTLQWHGGHAKELIEKIRDKNPTKFTSLYTQYNATFPMDKTWWGYSVAKGDNNYNAIQAIITSDEGKLAQDEFCNEYLSQYVDVGVSLGVTDYKAQIFFCDMYNQSPAGASEVARSALTKTLDGLFNEVMNGNYWLSRTIYNNRDRRIRVYNKIKELDVNAAINSVTSTNLQGAMSIATTFMFPTDCKNVTVPFVKQTHPTIFITEDGIEGTDVRAAQSGKLKAHRDSKRGTWIEITSGKYITRYYHLLKITNSRNLETEYGVEAGDVIGYVGHTGDITEPGLEFALLVNGIATDPVPYLTNVSTSATGTVSGLVETAVTWMINIANDNSHGYSQEARIGPDYDCTSLPTHGYIAAGLTDLSPWTYTGNMKANYEAVGFTAIPYTSGMTLLRGDVIFWHKYDNKGHAVTYLGDGQIVSAHSNKDGRQGDSSGNEIDVSNFDAGTSWQWVMRYQK